MIPQKQGSEEWLKWRQDKITGTDAGIILGVNPYKSIGELLDQKLGFRPPDEENEAMARGKALEDEARDEFERITKHLVFPQVCINAKACWQVASLDGLSIEKDVGVEIKCPGARVAYQILNSKEIPAYYMAQMQHQMLVTGLNSMYFYSYHPENDMSSLLLINRDQFYINRLVEKEQDFYSILMQAIKNKNDYLDSYDRLKDELYQKFNNNNEEKE